jgi:outer membrane protein TolC
VANLDEILRRYAAFTEDLMTGVGPMKGKEPISKQFPFPGVTALKGQVVSKAAESAKQSLEIARRNAVADISRTFWELSYAERARDITAETLELLRHLEAVADTRYRSGNTSFQDVVKIRIRTAILEDNLTTLRETERNLEAGINRLLNIPPETRLGRTEKIKPPDKVPPLDRVYRLAAENRQEIRRIRAQIDKMERMVEMAETMVYPTYTLGFSFYDGEAIKTAGPGAVKPAFSTVTSAGGGAGLPRSPWYGIDDPWLRQTRMNLSAKRQDLQNALATTDNLARNAWFAMDKALREYELYRDRIVDLSKSALEVSNRGYESGNVTFADVIGSHTNWLEVNLAAARKRSDAGIAAADLEKAVGVPFEKISGGESDGK